MTGDLALDRVEHRAEELESLALVLLLRLLLRIAAQVDPLPQVIERGEVLSPMRVDRLQHHRALVVVQHFGLDGRELGVVFLLRGLDHPNRDLLVVERIVGFGPFGHRRAEEELALELALQAGEVPLLLDAARRNELPHRGEEHVARDRADGLGDLLGLEQLVSLLVDHLALVVGDVVELEQLLANVEVARLDLALRVLDGARHHARLDRLSLGNLERAHDRLQPLAGEDLEQRILERKEKTRAAGISLARGPSPQLVVDAARLVALGAHDMQPARGDHLFVQLLPRLADLGDAPLLLLGQERLVGFHALDLGVGVAAQHDVRAAPRHVGGDGDLARPARLLDDLGLARVLLRVEHVVRDLHLLHHRGDELGILHRGRAEQHRLAARAAFLHLVHDGLVLLLRGDEDLVVAVLADHRAVGGNEHRLEVVDGRELERLGVRRPGHAGELLVEAEVILERDRGERLALVLDGGAFLRLHGLVQPVGPAPALHHAAGEFIDDHDLVVLDHVMLVAVVERMRPDPGVEVVHEDDVGRVVEARPLGKQPRLRHQLLGVLMPGFRKRHRVLLEIDPVIALALLVFLLGELRDQQVDLAVELGRVLGLAGDDERRARLVDQDRVDLVDDRVVEPALEALRHLGRHVVAQVVEAVLVVGAVGDVGAVRLLLLERVHLRHDHADAQSQEAMDAPHPLGVALGQVVVYGDHVHALAVERVQVRRQGGDECLAFAGAHLRDLAVVQRDAAHELHVEVAHAQHPPRGFAHHGERLGQHRIQGGAGGDLLLERRGLCGELGIGELLHRRLERVDRLDRLAVLLEKAVVAAAEDGLEGGIEHGERIGWFGNAKTGP